MKILLRILSVCSGCMAAIFAYCLFSLINSETEDKILFSILTFLIMAAFGFAAYKFGCIASGKSKKTSEQIAPSTWLPEPHIEKDTRSPKQRYLDSIRRIDAVTVLPTVSCPEIVLRPGEICHYKTNSHILTSQNVTTEYKTRTHSLNFNFLGRDVTSGRSTTKPVVKKVLTYNYGTLYMTNQRIFFVGKDGFDYPLSSLTAMTPNGYDRLILQFGSKIYDLSIKEPYWLFKILELLKKEN